MENYFNELRWTTYQQTSEQNIISIVLGLSVHPSVCPLLWSLLVIFNRIFSKFHIIIKLSFKFEYSFFFCQTISKKAVKMAAT